MQRSAIILMICIAGCSNQSTTPTPAETETPTTTETKDSTPSEAENRDTVGHADGRIGLVEETVGGVLLQPKTMINGKLTLLIPQGFSIMDEEMLKLKYPSERRPTLVYTNELGSINIAINHTKDRIQQSDIAAFHQRLDGMFRNLYPSATWFESGVIDINGREWLTLNLRTPAIDTEIRNIMIGTSVEGRLLLVSFNVTREQEDQWLEPAKAIVQSLRVND